MGIVVGLSTWNAFWKQKNQLAATRVIVDMQQASEPGGKEDTW